MCMEQGIGSSPNTCSKTLFIQARSASKGMRVALRDWVADSSRLRFGLGWEALFIQARSASKGMRVALRDWVADSSRLRFGRAS